MEEVLQFVDQHIEMRIEGVFDDELRLFGFVLYADIIVFEEFGSNVIEHTLIIWELKSLEEHEETSTRRL